MSSDKKKITLFIGSLTGGGAERVTCNLANYLNKKGNDITLITMLDIEDNYVLNSNINRVYLLKKSERKNKVYDNILRYYRLYKYIKNNNPDCYVVMLPITSIMLLSLRRFIKSKIIVSERNFPDSYSKMIQILLRYFSKKADGYVFQTIDASSWYNKVRDSIIIPNAINESFITTKVYSGVRDKSIVAVGRLHKQKNFSLLIESFNLIKNDYPDYNLLIYGEGKEKESLQNLINQLDLYKRVKLMGYSKNIKKDIYNKSLYILSSDFEGMPNSLIEAMALGLPCISTNCPCGGPRYLIQNEKNGLLVKTGDIDEMVLAIKKILDDKKSAELLGKNAHKIVDKLNPDVIYEEWFNYICKIITDKKGDENG